MLVGVVRRHGTNRVYVCRRHREREVYYKELVHAVKEAAESLRSADSKQQEG